MQPQTDRNNGLSTPPRFEVSFANTRAEILETLKLRYRIFAGEMGAQIDGGDEHIDTDEYDAHCRHLMVRELESGRVIACTRILTDECAAAAGGFYSSSEFDLQMIDALPGRVMEIAGFITREGYDYLFGCASIGLEDGGARAHAILDTIRQKYSAPAYQRVRPYVNLPTADARPTGPVRMPPLLKAYVNLGAKACGDAYWDTEFNCADVFMLLNVSDLNPRYARHFLDRASLTPVVTSGLD